MSKIQSNKNARGNIELFGQFLIRVSNGKVSGNDIMKALFKQERFSDGHMKLGEILVEDRVLTKEELLKYLEEYENDKNN